MPIIVGNTTTNSAITSTSLSEMAPQSFVVTNALRNSVRPALLLPFAQSGTVDPRITFTRASSATYFNSQGILTTAAVNVPRIDYDPVTGRCLGLLIEEGRSNFATNSIAYGAAASSSIPAVSLISLTNSSGTATATTNTSHGLATGNIVIVIGCTPSNFNGIFPIIVTGATTFTYIMTSNPGANASVVGSYTAQTTGGTIPTRWNTLLSAAPAGMSATLVATGTYNGIPTIDINYSGTPSSTGNFFPTLDNQSYSASPGQKWTISIYIALIGGTLPGAIFYVANYNIDNVAVNIASLSITNVLQRIAATSTAAAGVTTIGSPFFNIPVTAGTYYNFTLRIGLPQLELGAFPTSPILTGVGGTLAAASRIQELARIPLGSWYKASAFSLLVEAQKNTAADTGYGTPVELNDGTADRRTTFYNNPSSALLRFESRTSSTLSAGTYTLATPYKAAGAITGTSTTTGTIAASLNGATTVTGTTTNFESASYTNMNIGFIAGAGNFMNGWIQRIAYYPVAFSNTQLQAMSS